MSMSMLCEKFQGLAADRIKIKSNMTSKYIAYLAATFDVFFDVSALPTF